MSAIFDDATFWQGIGYVIGAALATALVAFAVRFAARWFKDAWWMLRVYVPAAINQVDQPSDLLLAYLGRKLEVYWPTFEQNAAAFLPVFLRSLADGIDKVLGGQPIAEDAKPQAATEPQGQIVYRLEPDGESWSVQLPSPGTEVVK